MISFFRNILGSKLVLALFALIILAFMITGFGTDGMGGLGTLSQSGTSVAKVGGLSISSTDLSARVQSEYESARSQQPGLTLAQFSATGGVDQAIDRMINSRTLLAFAQKNGMEISERLIDSEIAKIQSFRGPTGKFDRDAYLRVIGQQRLSEKEHRLDVKANLIADQIVPAVAGAVRAPKELLSPYASLLLEKRFGQVALIPTSRFMGAPATDAEIKTFYDRNLTRYTVPETRVVRYALFDRERFEGKVAATDAEIEAAYKADAAKYAASEKRTLTQVIVPDQAKAKAIASAARGGAGIEKAAKDAGLEAVSLDPQDKKAYASLASVAVSDAAFGTAKGGIAEPARSGLGWHVVRVDAVQSIAGKSLAEVRGALAPGITSRKVDEAFADMVTRIDDAISDGSTFDEVAAKEGLSIVTSPALTEGGIAPTAPGFKAPAELTAILKDAYQSEPDDDASVVTIVAGQSDAIVKLDKINPAAPKPLADIKAQVAEDAQADRASRAARKAATDLVTKVNGGKTLAEALTAASLPAASAIAGQRIEIARAQGKAPPVLDTLFKLATRKARMVEEAGGKGYAVVWLERLEAGDARKVPELLAATEGELSQAMGNELTQQLLTAMKADLGLQRNDAAIAAVKKALLGGTAGQ